MVAPVITLQQTFVPVSSDRDLSPFPLLPSHLTGTVAGKSKSFKHRKSIDGTLCDESTTSALQDKIIEPFTSVNAHNLKTASGLSSETFIRYNRNYL